MKYRYSRKEVCQRMNQGFTTEEIIEDLLETNPDYIKISKKDISGAFNFTKGALESLRVELVTAKESMQDLGCEKHPLIKAAEKEIIAQGKKDKCGACGHTYRENWAYCDACLTYKDGQCVIKPMPQTQPFSEIKKLPDFEIFTSDTPELRISKHNRTKINELVGVINSITQTKCPKK